MLKNPLQYSISTLLVVTFLVAIGITVGPATWFLIGIIELGMLYVAIRTFSENLPRMIEEQMKANALRSDGSRSSRRKKIEEHERSRFKLNMSILLLIFLATTNVGLLTLRVDRLFEVETYIVASPEVEVRPRRKISQAQYARELGGDLITESQSFRETTRMIVLVVAGSIWALSLILIPVGYLGMLRTMDSEVCDRAEYYRSVDYVREAENSS